MAGLMDQLTEEQEVLIRIVWDLEVDLREGRAAG
jgi:hypothetical protein